MLSWTKTPQSYGKKLVCSHTARTSIGTAVIDEMASGVVLLDMWRPNQEPIGRGNFYSVDAAKTRAEQILDPRSTAWDMLDDPRLG